MALEFVKTQTGSIFRLEDVWYIDILNDTHTVHFTNGIDLPITLVDYTMLLARLLSTDPAYYMCENGNVFNIHDIMIVSPGEEDEHFIAGVYLYNNKHEDADVCVLITETDYDNICEKLNIK